MKQGYNDRIDDSLGNKDGKKSSKEQNYKDRRDEAKAMNKAEGKRAYQSVDTMDKKSFDEIWSKFKADTKKAFGGDKYAKGGGVDDTYKKMIEAKGKQFVFERILKDSQFYQTNEMDKDDFIYDKNGRDFRAYPSNEKIDLYINWRSSNSSQKVTFSQPSELAEYLDNNQIYAKGGKIFNLEPVDSRKSFYGKAKGINLGNTTQLQSYDTIVAEYDNVNKKMTINDYYSPTTARHINAFLDYYGYPTMSKSEMLSVKGTKFEKGGAISSNYFSGMLSFLNY